VRLSGIEIIHVLQQGTRKIMTYHQPSRRGCFRARCIKLVWEAWSRLKRGQHLPEQPKRSPRAFDLNHGIYPLVIKKLGHVIFIYITSQPRKTYSVQILSACRKRGCGAIPNLVSMIYPNMSLFEIYMRAAGRPTNSTVLLPVTRTQLSQPLSSTHGPQDGLNVSLIGASAAGT
jgi:hypothetical protein